MSDTLMPSRFQLAPTVSGVELDGSVAAELTHRVLSSTPRRALIESALDPEVPVIVDVNGSYPGAETKDPSGIIVNIELSPERKHDPSEVYGLFMQGIQGAMFSNPSSRRNQRRLADARYDLITIPRPLPKLLSPVHK